MPEPLNPRLYRALQRRFHHVEIANEGEQYIPSRVNSQYRRGRIDSPPAYAGEYYRVACPYCGDTRKRLWINHMFAVAGEDGDDHLYLAICYNEGCIDCRAQQQRLYDMIYPVGYRAQQRLAEFAAARPAERSQVPSFEQPVQLPPSVSLSDSIATRARDYLMSRGFDPTEIVALWGATYCATSPGSLPRVYDRIVIPVHALRQRLGAGATPAREVFVAGWQAREIGNTPGSRAKYLSMKGMRKSHLLYGLPRAVEGSGPLVLVEGPTDVWRLGGNAVATFGKTMSPSQVALLLQYFARRPIVVMLDRDARAESQTATGLIRAGRRQWNDSAPVICAEPPDGMQDIGDCSREQAWNTIRGLVPA